MSTNRVDPFKLNNDRTYSGIPKDIEREIEDVIDDLIESPAQRSLVERASKDIAGKYWKRSERLSKYDISGIDGELVSDYAQEIHRFLEPHLDGDDVAEIVDVSSGFTYH